MDEMDFTLEFHTDLDSSPFEDSLFAEADRRLRELRGDHTDMIGATVTIRTEAARETPLYEATVVATVRPDNIVAREQDRSPEIALGAALDAVERQIRDKREKLGKPWEQPGNEPLDQEAIELMAAERQIDDELSNNDPAGDLDPTG
jgi:hypothetical protein